MHRTVFYVVGGTALFAAVHSLLATNWMKRIVEERFGSRARNGLYRMVYNNYTMVWLGVMFWLFSRLPDRVIYKAPRRLSRLMRLGQLVGVFMILDTTFRVGPGRFTGMQQAWDFLRGRDPAPEPPAQGPNLDIDLPRSTGGVFSFSRHPNNLGPTLVVWLQPKMTITWLSFATVGTLYALLGSIHEEIRLQQAYGDRYEEYRRRVPFFFPYWQ